VVAHRSPIRCRHDAQARAMRAVLAGLLLGLTAGCGSFLAQGKNADGVKLFEQAQYHDALRDFQEATYDDPANADGYYNLAATYHQLGRTEHRQGDLDQAEAYYNQCLDHHPSHTDCYRGLAVLLAEQGRSQEAFRLVEGWVDREPSNSEARVELARLFDEFNQRQAAKEHLLEALAISPDNPRALAALGKIREDMGERTQALAAYQRSLSHDSRQTEVAARVAALHSSLYPTASAASGTAPVFATVPGVTPAGTPLLGAQPAPLR
jgi:tetratricopeptide (TPR) repeat protein